MRERFTSKEWVIDYMIDSRGEVVVSDHFGMREILCPDNEHPYFSIHQENGDVIIKSQASFRLKPVEIQKGE